MGIQIDHSSVRSILSILNRSWYPQVKEVILYAICYSLWDIRHSRNSLNFDSKWFSMEATCNSIAANVSFAGLFCKGQFSSDVSQLMVLKKFNILVNLKKAPNIKEVL